MLGAFSLAVSTGDPRDFRYVFIAGGIVILGVLAAFFVYSAFKRWMNDTGEPSQAPGFTLSDLRKMRDQGMLSADEFEQTRSKMVAAAKRMTADMPDLRSRRNAGDSVEPDPHEPEG